MSAQKAGALITVLLASVFLARAQQDFDKITPQAAPFPITQVQLLDSPFKKAQRLDEDYLLRLDPDRLLSWYFKEAGLPAKGIVYGGWESSGLAGHTLGHYLSACSLMYEATGDSTLHTRVDYIVDQLAQCQAANYNGYIAAIPGGKDIFEKVSVGKIDTKGFGLNGGWSPWYTIHKELAGLIDAYQLCNDDQALIVATNLANWVFATTTNLNDAQWQNMLVCEYGGMNEALANLYGITGNATYLKLAEKFYDHRVLDPLAAGQDDLNGKHSNTQIPKIIGLARLYELTGDQHYADAAKSFWQFVALNRSFAIGGNGDNEHFFPEDSFARHISPATAETCCTYNILKLTRELFGWQPDAAKMDFYERALYNDILASQDPRSGMFVYLMSLKPGHFKTFSTPENSFWCCVGTGMENHAKYADTIYYQNDSSLYVNLFIPSVLSWPDKNLTVRQETAFPEDDVTHLTMTCARPTQLSVKIRWPAWVDKITVRVNGKKQKITGQPESYVSIDREWHDGDRIDVQLPMKLHTEPLPGTTNIVALLYGPIVLAGRLGTEGMPNQYAQDQTAFNHSPDPEAPVFVGDMKTLLDHIRSTGDPLTFRTKGLGQPQDVELIPFYKLNYERYSIYWNVVSSEDWKKNPAQIQSATSAAIETALNAN